MPAIAGIIGVEFVVVLFLDKARRARLLPTVLAGFFIALAWAATRSGAALPLVFAALLCALVAHAVDLRSRW